MTGRPPAMLVPPPFYFAAALLFGWLLGRVVALPILTPTPPALAWLGIALIVAALATILMSMGLFARAGTTIIPHGQARVLVVRGPYRVTRNPMYVGLTTLYLGLTALFNSYWPLVFLAIPLVVVGRIVIPYEERQLRQLFGDSYNTYCRQVRRWL